MRAPGQRQLEVTLKQLEVAVSAGVPLRQAFGGAGGAGWLPPESRSRFVAAIQRDEGVAGVLAAMGGFSRAEVALVRSAEQAGTLDATLPLLRELVEARRRSAEATRSALAYPVFLLVFASVLLPLPLAVSQGVGAWLVRAIPVPLFVVALVVFALRVWPSLDPDTGPRAALRSIARSLPFVGASMRASAVALFADVLGRCVGAGLGLWQAMDLAIDASGDPALRRQSVPLRRVVERTGSIAEGLRSTGVIPSAAISRVAVGEQTGHLDRILMALAAELREEADRRRRSTVALVGGLVFLIVAASIGWGVVRGFMGYLDMIDSQIEGASSALDAVYAIASRAGRIG